MRLRHRSRRSLAVAVLVIGLLGVSTPPGAVAVAPNGYSTFKNSFTLSTNANQLVTVARLRVPAGRYAIFSKLWVNPPSNGSGQTVRCDLIAGADLDRSVVTHDAVIAFATMALNVVHVYKAGGLIRLNCGLSFVAGKTSLGYIKITAISLNTLSNVRSP